MKRTTSTRKAVTAQSPTAAANMAGMALKESEAAQLMWIYYRDHKTELIEEVRECRTEILAEVMAGKAVEMVFAGFFKPPPQTKSKSTMPRSSKVTGRPSSGRSVAAATSAPT